MQPQGCTSSPLPHSPQRGAGRSRCPPLRPPPEGSRETAWWTGRKRWTPGNPVFPLALLLLSCFTPSGSLQTDEQRARQMLQKYSTQIRTIHRQVEQLNLPGLPKDYLDYFFGVSDEIKKLADELNEYKINMDEITKQLIIVESDLDTLNDKTDILRDSAELTERFQQYANRFSDNEKIAAAAKKSQELFKQFNYTASLEAIATVLEEIEPGSYKRIEDTYYREIGKN